MSPEAKLILLLGRAVLAERNLLLSLAPINPDEDSQREYAHQFERVAAFWDIYKMTYTRLFHSWPRFQLKFY